MSQTQDRESISQLASELIDAFGSHDPDRYFSFYTPDATFIFYTSPVVLESLEAYRDAWKAWESEGFRIHRCESSDIVITFLDPDVALFTHHVTTDLTDHGERSVVKERESIIWKRDPARGWVAVHEHLSPIPK